MASRGRSDPPFTTSRVTPETGALRPRPPRKSTAAGGEARRGEMTSPLEQYLAELSDPDKPVVASKLANLSDLSPEEMEAFKTAWPEIDTERRRQIVGWLEELQADNFEMEFDDVLIHCLDDPDSQVRVSALEGLWACEEPSLTNRLTELLLGDAEHTVRAAAAGALGRYALMAELGKLAASDSLQVEEALLSAFNRGDETLDVRCRVLEAVSALSKPRVEDLIRQAYHSEVHEFQASALFAMGRNCNPSWLPILFREFRSPNPQLRFEAVRACAELEAEEAVPHLIELSRDSDTEVRVSAIEALGRIGGSEARAVLEECVESTEEPVREAASEALDELKFWEDPTAL